MKAMAKDKKVNIAVAKCDIMGQCMHYMHA
jgi:hypothetical protein